MKHVYPRILVYRTAPQSEKYSIEIKPPMSDIQDRHGILLDELETVLCKARKRNYVLKFLETDNPSEGRFSVDGLCEARLIRTLGL